MRALHRFYNDVRRNRRIRRAYGILDPTETHVVGGRYPLQVDPSDPRVRKILLYDVARGRQPSNQAFWFLANEILEPSLCVDVGLNYGECLLAGGSHDDARLHGFEANPHLRRFLDKTLANHPMGERIQIHYGAASDTAGEKVTLAVDPQWSGRSYVAGKAGSSDSERDKVEITTLTLDGTLPRPSPTDSMLFKIDVEGYEAAVIRGMHETIEAVGSSVGFMEFNPPMMADRSGGLDRFWDFLATHFEIRLCSRTANARRIISRSWHEAIAEIKRPYGDLILLSDAESEPQRRLLQQWMQRSERRDRKAS